MNSKLNQVFLISKQTNHIWQQSSKSINQNFAQNRSIVVFQKQNQKANYVNLHQSIHQFSTSSKRQAIPPLLWLIAKPLTKLTAIIAGRGFRKWWTALPQFKRTIFKEHLIRNKFRYFGITSTLTITSSVWTFMHIQETPITKRKRFIMFNSDHLEEIERLEKDQIFIIYEKKILDMYSPYTNRALKVANRLFDANRDLPEVAGIKWKLTVIDDDIVNAAAFPSGDLVVFTGLLDFVENDDEIAIILAHEMTHAILQHAAEEISHSRLLDFISIGLCLVVWAFLPTDFTAILTQLIADRFLKIGFELPYSRILEKEADAVGLMMAAKACFDVRYSPVFWRRMGEYSEEVLPEILSTHPTNETRALDLEQLMPAALQLRKDCHCNELPKTMPPSSNKHKRRIENKINQGGFISKSEV